jgi:hypothetical protein
VTDATQERLAIEGDGGIAEQSVTIAELDGVDVGYAVGFHRVGGLIILRRPARRNGVTG